MTYTFEIQIPTRSIIAAASGVEGAINESMKGFGFDEKMVLLTTFSLDMTCDRELTQAELMATEGLIGMEYEKRYPGSKITKVTKKAEQ